MRTTRNLRLTLAVPVLAVAALTACSGSGPVTASGTAGPAGVSTSTPAAATTSATTPAAPATTTSGSGSGSGSSGACTGSGSIPSGAGKATTADLDGDGKKDTIWLADAGSKRELGVKTAAGKVFSTTFTSAAPQAANAVAGVVEGDPVILLDTGRSVQLYTVNDCKIVVTKNPQGQQYTFDKGFTGFGTGVGCPSIGGELRLAGYNATSGSGSKYTVTRTVIDLSSGGTKASNGTKTTLGKNLSSSSSLVRTATSVTCGSGNTASEPQS